MGGHLNALKIGCWGRNPEFEDQNSKKGNARGAPSMNRFCTLSMLRYMSCCKAMEQVLSLPSLRVRNSACVMLGAALLMSAIIPRRIKTFYKASERSKPFETLVSAAAS
eukprot:926163-Pelagomonas_calceolata.AAC.1